jgi:hypothetical protein
MRWKTYERKQSRHNLRYYFNVYEGTEENHEKPNSGYLVFGLRFDPGITQIQSRSDIT